MTASAQLRLTPTLSSRDQRDHFSKALTDAIATRGSQLDDLPRATGDPVLRAQRDALEAVLKEISSALRRLDEGRFGTCRGCAEPIPTERLAVRPWSSTCVGCARM